MKGKMKKIEDLHSQLKSEVEKIKAWAEGVVRVQDGDEVVIVKLKAGKCVQAPPGHERLLQKEASELVICP